MGVGTWVLVIWAFIVGLIVGVAIKKLHHYSGVLKIDTSDPETDMYSIEITDPLDDIPKMKTVTFKIDVSES